jgi:lipoic acid synthetase
MEKLFYITTDSKDAAFWFALEEYITKNREALPVMMVWQTEPCVMLGNNQIAEAEADITYANREGITIVRRLSGGGAVYADGGTVLFSLITSQISPEEAKKVYADSVTAALVKMGVPAKAEGRNDICAEGKKIAGIAQYARYGSVCTHGSLLYDTDLEKLACVLKADDKKFYGKAVRSVRSRVANIKDYMNENNSVSEFVTLFKKKLLDGKQVSEYDLTDDDLTAINKIYEEKYNNPTWTYKRVPESTFHNSKRFPGGTVEIFLDIANGIVRGCSVRGDFLSTAPIRELELRFIGIPYLYKAFADVLDGIPMQPFLGHIGKGDFLSCAFEAMPDKPDWLRVRYSESPNRERVEEILRDLSLNTVCREANCPNIGECFSQKTATFMIMGICCTRDCRFCNVRSGPAQALNPNEPRDIAQAVKELGLKYAVITSVTRDDLPDGGAGHFTETIKEIRQKTPETAIEVLIPDFAGNINALKTVTDANPRVISHNMETVESLYVDVRPQAEYTRSLNLLRSIKELNPDIRTKSGFMLGLGETDDEVRQLMKDLREAGCDFLTIGQYLAPSPGHYPVKEYVTPQRFKEWGVAAKEQGFTFVASAPLVRSSYRAGEMIGI